MRSLVAFEAAARHRNMVRAAEELGMTQGAISRHIRALEDQVREPLFVRGPRGVALTEAGDLLFSYAMRGLKEISEGFGRLWQPQRRETLEVRCSRTFAIRVLAPRVLSFAREFPWIDLQINSHRYYTELEGQGGVVAIRLGQGDWPDMSVTPLTQETLFPVCAPALARGTSEPQTYLGSALLLHYTERPHWTNWLHAAGLPTELAANGPRFSEMSMALAAAESGQGVAIARRTLVVDAIAEGRLVRPFAPIADDGEGYFLVTTPAARHSSTVQAFSDWLQGEVQRIETR